MNQNDFDPWGVCRLTGPNFNGIDCYLQMIIDVINCKSGNGEIAFDDDYLGLSLGILCVGI